MDWLMPALPFKTTGPIYPLVLSYLAQLHGAVELASRGLFLRVSGMAAADRENLPSGLSPENAALVTKVLAGGITQLIDDPSPATLVGPSLKIDVSKLAAAVFSEEAAIRHFNTLSAGSLLVLSWEHTEDIHTRDSLWEFLRHLRNAVAHGGRFHFLRDEPVRPAVWRSKSIDRSLGGMPVFAAPVHAGFLGTGDVLHLLSDIDQKFIS